MTTVTENLDLPAGADPIPAPVVALRLVGADGVHLREARDTDAGTTIVGEHLVLLDGVSSGSPTVGTWSLPLPANDLITPAGTVWARTVTGPRIATTVSYAEVPETGGPYEWKLIETDPPAAIDPSGLAAHAADDELHGGGQELALANVTANFSTASTSFVDIPGASVTFLGPDRPYVVSFSVPVTVAQIGQGAEMRILGGATQVDWDFTPRASVAGQTFKQRLVARIPAPTFSPTPGDSVTYKAQLRTIAASSNASITVDFGGPFQLSQLHAVTC